MKALNGLVEITTEVTVAPIEETFQKVAEIVDAAEVNLGDLADNFEEVRGKIETEVSSGEEPVSLSNEDENFIIGMALILNVGEE